ncbi:DUF3159 domain-containing protein [Nonomuraea sp. KC401]|uniref:DUF3159 domain-containing protein n=1 Tax=unclassified Nonomuraea TaxID=2593643 RepID=UPI0010FE82A8|nr:MULTISPECIES: DUF3159 domain-containing protein [unclassified Nonomuraea]NBE97251.1 DUF3159 domain-containing protein [Nonomuraea sp. K271]TLF65853.1 DUF3159 domain-containing protein [Nonomuraea sp. KC401]
MNFNMLTQKSLSLFAVVGGWRTLAEAITSRALFVVAYLVTGRVVISALIAVGGVFVFAVARVWTDRKYWQAAGGLLTVGVSAFLAGSTGDGVNFYLVGVLATVVGAVVFLVSMLVGWPLIGLVVGQARGERFTWRRDRARRRRYQKCTAVFVAKFALGATLMVPLYLAGNVIVLGIVSTLLTMPATAACAYVSWRILRTEADPTGAEPAVPMPI